MRIFFLILLSLLNTAVVVQPLKAQELDPQQLVLIRETVAGICNTIDDISGNTTRAEIEGKISTELQGLAKKFLSAGAEASGRYSENAFKGLTQDATATAIGDAARCRERLFLVMFEKISAFPESSGPDEEIVKLEWTRDLNAMVGSPDGNVPVIRIDLALNGDRAPYNSPFLTEIMFFDLTCEVHLWIDKIEIPEYPNGIGGVGLNETILPESTFNLKIGTNGIAINFNSSIVTEGYRRQQRIAIEAGDDAFAVAAKDFRRSYSQQGKSEKAWVSLAVSAPAEGCKGSYSVRYPVSRRTKNETTTLIEM